MTQTLDNNMTIGEAINGKLRRAKIVGFLFWLAFAATMFIPREGRVFFISMIPFAGFGGTILYIFFFIKCPRCGAPLGQAGATSGSLFSKKTKLNFCPNCGVNLNEPS